MGCSYWGLDFDRFYLSRKYMILQTIDKPKACHSLIETIVNSTIYNLECLAYIYINVCGWPNACIGQEQLVSLKNGYK